MFEPTTPECKLYPTDSKEEIGKEEWIAEKAMEVRINPDLMFAAMEWDGDQTGSGDLYLCLAQWMKAQQLLDLEKRFYQTSLLEETLHELAERYAEYVLLPAHIEKMKNGDYCG